jgi:cytochrome b561
MGIVLVSGYLMVPDGYDMFGVLPIATPFEAGPLTAHWFAVHRYACIVLFALVVLHLGAVIRHIWGNRGGFLRRMM